MVDMALNIKSPEVDRLARELSVATGESLTQAVETALRERLERSRDRDRRTRITGRLAALAGEFQAVPVADARAPEEIVGYDEHGLPA